MTIWISQELPLFNFEPLDILCARIGHPCENLWPFEFLESICCSISSVSVYYVPESDIRVKSCDNLNFYRASIVQFQASRYIMHLNRTSEWKFFTIWISRKLPLFNFKRPDMLCAESVIRAESYYHLNFLRASVVQFRASRYIILLNRTSEWKVITVGISIELPIFNFKGLNTLCTRIGHPSENLWQFEFLGSFRSLISSISRYVMRLNRTSEWKVMTIWISQELPLFNFEHLDILFPRFGHSRENLWQFEFL